MSGREDFCHSRWPAGDRPAASKDAPDAQAAAECHREAHSLVAEEIYPVVQG